ncbi:MAG: metal ABC transporter permease [Clostridia bacterium]|nr:metal ABC transporter permease [Clostridiales bacterium]MBQ3232502.1 metal ABC transporter permease [Clostridia bacterium]
MMLKTPLVKNALLVGALVSLCAALLGVILVLKHYALIGHGLGEVGFAAMSVAALIGLGDYPLVVAIPVVCLSSILIMRINQKSGMGGDVLIGIFSTSALAVGVLASAYTSGYSGVYNSMFGSLYAVGKSDVVFSVSLSAAVILIFLFLYNRLFSVTYDETYARATDMNADLYQFLISLLTSVSIVLGMRVMGAMMISSFIIFPAITAKRIARSFRSMLLIAVAVALFSFFVGVTISLVVVTPSLPTGACVVSVSVIVMLAAFLFTKVKR